MKKLLVFLVIAAMALSLAACSVSTSSGSGDSSGSSSGGGIRLFNGKIEIATALNHAAEAYEEATGKHVEVESLGGGVDLQATLKQ